MIVASWSIDRWKEIFEIVGTPCALLFTGFALRIDSRVRHTETLLEITKLHRELWTYFDERPQLAGLFDEKRDMATHPLADEEVRFANLLFLHLRAAYGAKRGRIFSMPERVGDAWREMLSYPALASAWNSAKHLHDRKFVALVERYRSKPKIKN